MLWTAIYTPTPAVVELNDDAEVRGRLPAAIPSIGRIELPGNFAIPVWAHRVRRVGERLIMTNRHVAAIFTSGVGSRRISPEAWLPRGDRFEARIGSRYGPHFGGKRVVMVHRIGHGVTGSGAALPDDARPLRLSLSEASADSMIEVASDAAILRRFQK
jgi:endonuclease G